jgi:hypothetical protein
MHHNITSILGFAMGFIGSMAGNVNSFGWAFHFQKK